MTDKQSETLKDLSAELLDHGNDFVSHTDYIAWKLRSVRTRLTQLIKELETAA